MSYEHTTGTRVVIRCNGCHRAANILDRRPAGEYGAVPLPPGWARCGSVHTCPRCAARRACAAAGHDFGPWRELPDAPDHLAERVCLGCGADELAPAYVLAPRSRRVS